MKALLATTCWLFAVLAFIGGLLEFGTTWVACWGLAAAFCGLVWGLLISLAGDRDRMVGYREQVWARRDTEAEEAELPYRPVSQSE